MATRRNTYLTASQRGRLTIDQARKSRSNLSFEHAICAFPLSAMGKTERAGPLGIGQSASTKGVRCGDIPRYRIPCSARPSVLSVPVVPFSDVTLVVMMIPECVRDVCLPCPPRCACVADLNICHQPCGTHSLFVRRIVARP